MRTAFISILTFLAFTTCVVGQDIVVRGTFLADSMRVGDEIFYSLSARYPAGEQIVFPDTSYFYDSFEFIGKKFYPTKTRNGVSVDSAIYRLTTFETDSLLRLRLPVFQVNALDCTRVAASWDTIRMQLMVKAMPEQIGPDMPLRATIAYQDVPRSVNYPLILALAGLSVVLAVVTWVIFGDRLRGYLKEKKMRRAHEQFLARFDETAGAVTAGVTPKKAEAVVLVWKRYMEHLNQRPYTKMTTLETVRVEKDQQLATSLRRLDASIYGTNTDITGALGELRRFADATFETKLNEVRHEQ